MSEQKADDGRWGWPVGFLVAGVGFALVGAGTGTRELVLIGWLVLAFGALSIAIRRGAFTPRR